MASSDATPFPIKGKAYRATFPIFDADGDLVTGAAGLDSEVSKDGGTFADCTNEATEIATASGMYYLDLSSTEMNADTVAIIVKTSTSGAKTTPIVLYPITNGLDIPVNATYLGGTAQTGRDIGASVLLSSGTGTGQLSFTSGILKVDVDTIKTQALTASGGITFPAATLASTTNITAITGNITGNLSGSVGSVTGAVGSVTGAVGSVTGLTASDVGAIKAKTDSLTFTQDGNVDANIQYVNDVAVTGDGQPGTEWGP